MSSWTIWVQLFLPNKVLKCNNPFQWLICPKSVFLYCWFWQCQLTSSKHGVRLLNLMSYVFVAGSCKKEYQLFATVEAEVGPKFSFEQGWSFFQAYITSTSRQRFLGIFALLELISFYLFYFHFSNHYSYISSFRLHMSSG